MYLYISALGVSLTARIAAIRNTSSNAIIGWGDTDTHFAFAMMNRVNLTLLQSTAAGGVYPNYFSALGHQNDLVPQFASVVGVYVDRNHFMAIFPL